MNMLASGYSVTEIKDRYSINENELKKICDRIGYMWLSYSNEDTAK
jgi:hypothetical protein